MDNDDAYPATLQGIRVYPVDLATRLDLSDEYLEAYLRRGLELVMPVENRVYCSCGYCEVDRS